MIFKHKKKKKRIPAKRRRCVDLKSAMIVRLAVQYATPVEVHLTCRFRSRSILDFEQFSIFSSQRPSQGPVDHRGHPCCSNVRCMPTEADRPLCGSEKKLGILLHLLPPGIYSPSRKSHSISSGVPLNFLQLRLL